jgi:hypothetical protein
MAIVAALVPIRRSDAGSGTLLEQVEWNVGPYQLPTRNPRAEV